MTNCQPSLQARVRGEVAVMTLQVQLPFQRLPCESGAVFSSFRRNGVRDGLRKPMAVDTFGEEVMRDTLARIAAPLSGDGKGEAR